MLSKELHSGFIAKTIGTKDILYYLTKPLRMSTVYWAVNSLKMLRDSRMDEQRPAIVGFVRSCLNEDGGFGGNTGFPSAVLYTFNALQILYLYGIPYYNEKTVAFILKQHQPDGSFVNDEFLEKDTRIDCCAVLSLRLMEIMGGRARSVSPGPSLDTDQPHFIENSNAPFARAELEQPISESFAAQIGSDRRRCIRHLLNCYNSDGGFGQIPGSESHAAQVFCCVSSLRSLGALGAVDRPAVEDFLVFRQCANGGLNGRINKKEDVCYSFWVLAALELLGSDGIDRGALQDFIHSCEGAEGGFSDREGNECDLYHLMYSLASLSIMRVGDFEPIDPGFAL